MSKVVVVGLDGASLDLIRPWAEAGELPVLGRLLREGAAGPLRSVVHPYTAQAWTTMVTGVNAGRHRLFDFWERDPDIYGFRLANASLRAAPALWTTLGARGHRVLVVNVPMTFPPEAVNGVMVSGRDTPGLSSAFTHPGEVKGELERLLDNRYVIVPNDWRWMRLGRPEEARQELLHEVDVRFAAVRHLMRTREWDFCMFVVGATDGAAHFFWNQHDPTYPTHDGDLRERLGDVLLEVYGRVDQRLGDLLGALDGETCVAIVSDHGSGSREPQAVHLNPWLAGHGWLTFSEPARPRAVLEKWTSDSLKRLKGWAYSLFPYQQLNKLRRLWPDRWRRKLSRMEVFGGIDWERTRAYSEERRGDIWINVRGRDPQGIVEPGAEYEALRAEISAALEAAVDEQTGWRLARRVWRREELFDGPFLDRIPDLLVETESPACFMTHDPERPGSAFRVLSAQELRSLHVSGDHRMDGELILWGPAIRPGTALAGIELRDVVPTLLYAMGEAIPAAVEGRVVLEAFEPEWAALHPARREQGDEATWARQGYDYTQAETEQIEERLAGLGYLG